MYNAINIRWLHFIANAMRFLHLNTKDIHGYFDRHGEIMCSINLFVLWSFYSVEQHCCQGRVEVGDETFREVIGVLANGEREKESIIPT